MAEILQTQYVRSGDRPPTSLTRYAAREDLGAIHGLTSHQEAMWERQLEGVSWPGWPLSQALTKGQMDDDRSSKRGAHRRPKSQTTAYFKSLRTMKRRMIAPITYNTALPAWRQAVFRWLRTVVLDALSDCHLARASPER